jgi:hypothetical protein
MAGCMNKDYKMKKGKKYKMYQAGGKPPVKGDIDTNFNIHPVNDRSVYLDAMYHQYTSAPGATFLPNNYVTYPGDTLATNQIPAATKQIINSNALRPTVTNFEVNPLKAKTVVAGEDRNFQPFQYALKGKDIQKINDNLASYRFGVVYGNQQSNFLPAPRKFQLGGGRKPFVQSDTFATNAQEDSALSDNVINHNDLVEIPSQYYYGVQLNPYVSLFNGAARITTGIGDAVNNVRANKKETDQYLRAIAPVSYQNNDRYSFNTNPVYTQMGGNAGNAVEAEKGEVYEANDGSINEIPTSAPTHEQGGVVVPDVQRVLENTSNLRKDTSSKYLQLSREAVKSLTGVDVSKPTSHAQAAVKANEQYEKERTKIVKNIQLASKDRATLDKYAENSTKLNLQNFTMIPTQEQVFNNLFMHQEAVKQAVGIGTEAQRAKYGGKYQVGGSPRPPRDARVAANYYFDEATQRWYKKPLVAAASTTTPSDEVPADFNPITTGGRIPDSPIAKIPAGPGDGEITAYTGDRTFKGNASKYTDAQWREFAQKLGFKGHGNVEFQQFLYSLPKSKPLIDALHTQYGEPNGGTRFDGRLGHRWDAFIDNYNWDDADLPQQPTTTPPAQNLDTSIKPNFKFLNEPKSTFNEPLRWYDVASPINAYMSSLERIPEKYNPASVAQVRYKLQDPTAALQQNQADFNAATQAIGSSAPNNAGVQMANISNLAAQKYAANNQILGSYENQNAQIKNTETTYNAQAQDRQEGVNQQAREAFEEKILTSKAKQQEQKLTALDSLYKTMAENRALNRNGNLIMKFSNAFDQYGNYNGYQHQFSINPMLGMQQNNATSPIYSIGDTGKSRTNGYAGGVQPLTPGKNYYNRRTGKTLYFDGNKLMER